MTYSFIFADIGKLGVVIKEKAFHFRWGLTTMGNAFLFLNGATVEVGSFTA